jgi:aspartate dehydrogenase
VKTVGIIGCGAIGTLIAKAVDKGIVACDKLVLHDLDMARAEKLKRSVHVPCTVAKSVEEVIKLKPAVVVEAASIQTAKEYVKKIVDVDIDLIVMSVGALLDLDLKNPRIHYPSGAIGGLDALSAADLAGVNEVVLTTRKSPRVLDMDNRKERIAFQGGAREAVKRFPREMNVAATLALTVGAEKVKVCVISDPRVDRNVHEVKVNWALGDMLLRFSNDPHPENPKTSALAAWSAIRLLKDVLEKSS